MIEARVFLVKSWNEKLHHLPKRGFFFKQLKLLQFYWQYSVISSVTLFNVNVVDVK